ncbi:MAG: hypothetical protein IPO60_14000 [Flavobacteriales bacterium]|nr:hypothetical protein [Flavobacteriales bacterium]
MTFGLVIVPSMSIGFISYIIYLPFILLSGFGAMERMGGMDDPAAMGERMGWLMTLMMALGGVMSVLLQPLSASAHRSARAIDRGEVKAEGCWSVWTRSM